MSRHRHPHGPSLLDELINMAYDLGGGTSTNGQPLKNLSKTIFRFNRRNPDGTFKVHWGVMFLSSDAYWAVGGCDEDFVGHYGGTDVHFFHRVRIHPEIRDSIRYDMTLQQLDYQMSPCEGLHDGSCSEEWVQRDPRDPSRNLALLAWKKKNWLLVQFVSTFPMAARKAVFRQERCVERCRTSSA